MRAELRGVAAIEWLGDVRSACGLLAIVGVLFAGAAQAQFHGRLPATPGGSDYQAFYDDELDVTWHMESNWAKARGLSSTGGITWTALVAALDTFEVNGIGGWRLPNVDRNGDGSYVTCWGGVVTQEQCKDSELAHLFWYGGGTNPDGSEGMSSTNPGPFTNDFYFGYYWSLNGCKPPSDPALCKLGMGTRFLGYAGTSVASSTWHALVVFTGDVDNPPVEICDNGVDDDGDGLTDGDDPDCVPLPPRVGLRVRCMHEPVYPSIGESVTITARAVDALAEDVAADVVEIFVADIDTPVVSVSSAAQATHTFTVQDETFSYGCRAERNATPAAESATSWRQGDPRLRTVDAGTPERPTLGAVPVILNGSLYDKIDVVFFADNDEYDSWQDPDFLADVHQLIDEGYFTVPWFVSFQWAFNFWVATDNSANATALPPPPGIPPSDNPFCNRVAPTNFEARYFFADTGAIVHRSVCRDNAGAPGLFTVEVDPQRLQVVAHETGHRPFGLADEYCCDGGYFSSRKPLLSGDYDPPYPNLFKTEQKCRDAAADRLFDADACRSFQAEGPELWWIGEPNYRSEPDPLLRVRDLMQQTGDADVGGSNVDRYDVGDSEGDRMSWWLSKCVNGEC